MMGRTPLPDSGHFVDVVVLSMALAVMAFPLPAETTGEKPAATPAITAPTDLKGAMAALAKVANPAGDNA